MKWFVLLLFLQLAMSGNPEEPPGPAEGGPDEPLDLKESCEQSKSQLVTLKEIMIRNKQSLKKKEEEIQVNISLCSYLLFFGGKNNEELLPISYFEGLIIRFKYMLRFQTEASDSSHCC